MAKWTRPEVPVVRVGPDELNLTRFPIALLSDRAEGRAILRFEDDEKRWTVAGHPEYGLPTNGDVAVYLALMELAREHDWPKTLMFSRYELLQRLGWKDGGDRYDRLRQAVARWVHVTITAQKCFFNARSRRVVREISFHLVDASSIVLPEDAWTEDLSRQETRQFLSIDNACWVRLSEPLLINCRKGYVKALDLGLYFQLQSSVAQALYRYLDGRRGGDGKLLFRQRARDLGVDHLGLSGDYAPSQLKRELERAHGELLGVGYLSGVRWTATRAGDTMVVYRFPKEKVMPPQEASLSPEEQEAGEGVPSAVPPRQGDLFATWSDEMRQDYETFRKRRRRARAG